MAEKRVKDLKKSISQLEEAMKLYSKEEDQRELNFLMLVKAYEILVENAWKYFKEKVEDEGLMAPSPKEAVRKAATVGMIDDPDKWIGFIEARNLSVHDYFTLDNQKFYKLADDLVKASKKNLLARNRG